ncbi:hypothetical protein [Neptuniibacter sp. QD37_11]|uniref:hypothetical protein n=1 Tax=Neptuniibacter sp. QD37_11 TaxID=3398209 RepID=UPI0039F59023
MNIQRPKITPEMIQTAAKQVANAVKGNVDDIVDCYFYSMDGFELGKSLERRGWDVDAEMISELDNMNYFVGTEHEKACRQYFEENNIQPPFAVGDKIKQGEITGICDYSAGKFLVLEPDQVPESTRRLLVNFEDAVAKPSDSA